MDFLVSLLAWYSGKGSHLPPGRSEFDPDAKIDIFASQKRRPIKLQHGTPEAVTFFARFRDYKQFGCGWFKADVDLDFDPGT